MPNPTRRRSPRREIRPALHPQRDGFHEQEDEDEVGLAREEILNHTPANADAQASVLERADDGTRVRAVQQLQREQGNAYVQRVVARRRAAGPLAVQRDGPKLYGKVPPTGGTPAPQPAGPTTATPPQPDAGESFSGAKATATGTAIKIPDLRPITASISVLQSATLSGHPYIGSLPVLTKDEAKIVEEANGYFESNPLEPWERSSGEHLQHRNVLTDLFQKKAYHLTLYMLEQSEAQAATEMVRYSQTAIPGTPETQQLRDCANHLSQVQETLLKMANNEAMMDYTHYHHVADYQTLDDFIENPNFSPVYVPGQPTNTDQESQDAMQNFPKVAERYKALREIYGQRFPVLLGRNQFYFELGNASDEALDKYVTGQSQEVIGNILKTREELKPEKIWALPPVIAQTKKLMGIADGTGANDAVQGKLDDDAWDHMLRKLAMAAIQIGLQIVAAALTSGASLVVRGAGILVAAAASAPMVAEEYSEYKFQKAMSGRIALDSAQRLLEEEPGYGWLAFDIAFMILDIGLAAAAFRALTKTLKAADALGDATKAVRAVTSLAEGATSSGAKIASTLAEVEEVVRAQARMLNQEGKLAAGLTEEIFVERVMSGLRRQVASAGAVAEQQAGVLAKVIDGSHPNFARLVNNDPEALVSLLVEHGDWRSLVLGLERSGQEQIAKNLVAQREVVIRDITAELKATSKESQSLEVSRMKGASDDPISDVDLQIGGPNAGEALIHAEEVMAQRFGSNWSEMFRMNFYTEGSRLTRYQEAFREVGRAERASMTARITKQTERFNFARMLQHAGDDSAALERVEQMAARMGVDLEGLRPLAKLDEAARTARRNALLLEIDELQAQFQTAKGAQRAELAEQISSAQIEANFYTYEANIGPGSLKFSGIAALAKAEGYQAALTQMEMIEHILALAGGDVVRASRDYELFKYIGRFGEVAEQAGVDSAKLRYVRNQANAVARGQREMMEETAHQFIDANKVRGPYIEPHDLPQHVGGGPAITDDFLKKQFDMYWEEANDTLRRLNADAPKRPPPPAGGGDAAGIRAAEKAAGIGTDTDKVMHEIEYADAWGETHHLKRLADGRVMRCSEECRELVYAIRTKSVTVRRWLAPESAIRAEASALTDEAKDLLRRAEGIPAGSPDEVKLLDEGREIAQRLAEVEQRAIAEVKEAAAESVKRIKQPVAGSDVSKALEADAELQKEFTTAGERLENQLKPINAMAEGQLDEEVRATVGEGFADVDRQARQLEQRALDKLAELNEAVDYAEEAKKLGYETRFGADRAPFDSHGQEVFFDGNSYITRDIDQHKGGFWKKFNRQGKRVGTYNKDLSVKVGK